MGKTLHYIWFCISSMASVPASGQETASPIAYSNPAFIYTQDFDNLPNTGSFALTGKGPFNINSPPMNAPGLTGWQIWMKSGSNTNAGFAISTGSSTGSNIYSLGSSGSMDRALGSLASGSGIYSFGTVFTNNTGTDLNTCTISFTMEQWRKGGSGNINTWSFSYKTGPINRIDASETIAVAELDMLSVISTSPATALNGNFSENQRMVSYTIRNILWKKGEQLLIRWDDTDETSSDDAMGIDNFHFSAEKIISLPVVFTQPAESISENAATISCMFNTGFGNSSVWFEYDTTPGFLQADTVRIMDSVPAGISDTMITINLQGLRTGSVYYYRAAAANSTGLATGNSLTFTTPYAIASLTTKTATAIRTRSALLGGNILSTGGADITEKGIVWSITGTPFITDNRIAADTPGHDYIIQTTDLPPASIIYVRAYAINSIGIVYGNTISFTTATRVASLSNTFPQLTNASSVSFIMQTEHPVMGITGSNFSVVTENISNASVVSVNGTASQFSITVSTGEGDGKLSLQFVNDTGLSVPIENKPFIPGAGYIIDKSAPGIISVIFPDVPMKYGDTVTATIHVQTDTGLYLLTSLKIAGQTATQFKKLNDSTYTAMIVIKNTTDIDASADIPVQLILRDVAGNNSTYTKPIIQSSDAIDVTRPTLGSVTLPPNRIYKAGDTLDFVFNFTEKIVLTGIAGSSTVSITVGSRSKGAGFVRANDSSIQYRYIIAIDESDNDGIRFSTPLAFRNINITDIAGNPVSLSYSFPAHAEIIVDAVLPKIGSVATPPPAMYKTGNILDFTVNFSKKIWVNTVAGVPSLQIVIGNTIRHAYYTSGEAGTALLFRYKITEDDMDKDGIKLNPAIQLNNALIYDAAGNNSLLQVSNTGALSGIIINPPLIAVSGLVLPPDSLYGTNAALVFIVQYNETAFVDTATGVPSLRFTAGSTYKYARYQSGSGTRDLMFTYTTKPGDLDTNGIAVSSTLLYNSGNIRDERGNTAPVNITGIGTASGIQIDAVQPIIRSVVTPSKNTYKKNDLLEFTVTFSEKINIDTAAGIPFITVFIGNISANAYYTGRPGNNSLLFSYLVKYEDMDTDGIKLNNHIQLNHSRIFDDAGNNVLLQLNNIGALSGIIINPPVIAVSNLALPPDRLYGNNEYLIFTVLYNENAFVDTTKGIPSLRFTAGSTYKYARYQSGSGTQALVFGYTTQGGDLDTNGIAVSSTLLYNNGNIKDERGNTAPTHITGIGSTSGIQIDAVHPTIKSVTTPEKNTYSKNDTLHFVVNFSERVFCNDITDSLFIDLIIGQQKKKAFYQNGIGTSALLFSYIIQRGDNDNDGIKLDSIISHTEILHDITGNTVIPLLKNIGALSGIKVSTPLPLFSSDSSHFTICSNQPIAIENFLASVYKTVGDQLVWQITAPAHGSVSTRSHTAISNNDKIIPPTVTYTPDNEYAGSDSLMVTISDGANTTQKTIRFIIHPPITDNTIGSAQNICITNAPSLLIGSLPSGGNGSYLFTWEAADATDTLVFSGTTYSKQDLQPGKLTANTWFRRKVRSGPCENISNPALVSVYKTGFWTGGFDSLWNNPNNWCMQTIPDQKTDVLIDGKTAFAPCIPETALCNNLSFLNNASLTVKGKLQVHGDIGRAGKINASEGTVSYSGDFPQILSAGSFINNTFKDLVIDNPAGVSADTFTLVTGKLILHSGTMTTNSKIKLSATAIVAPSASGTAIHGPLTIEHHIPGGRSAYRLMGHPFTMPVTLDMIKDSIDITGNGGIASGFTNAMISQPSAFLFHPGISNDSTGFEAGWQAVSSISELWDRNTGMRLLIRGRPGQGLDSIPPGDGHNGTYYPADTRIVLSGPVHTGDQELLLSKNIHPAYHVISNPYPCPIDLSLVIRGSGIAPHFWIWDPWQGNSGGYTSTRSADHFILPSFGAFIAKVIEPSENQLKFTENSKAIAPQTSSPDGNFIRLTLETGKIFWDRIDLFANDNTRIYTDENDAEKFNNAEVSFYSISRDKKALSTDTRPINNESVIPLGLQTRLKQSFTIRVSDIRMPPGNTLQLHDRYLGKWIQLAKDSAYSFTTTEDSLSHGEQRFEISSYRKDLIDTAVVYKLNTSVSPVPAHDRLNIRFEAPVPGKSFIRLIAQNGKTLKQINPGIQKNVQLFFSISDIPPGLYMLEIRCGEYSAVQKIIKQ